MPNPAQSARDNRANQLSSIHPAFYQSRGYSLDDAQRMAELNRRALDDRANQTNNSSHSAPLNPSASSSASSALSSAKPE